MDWLLRSLTVTCVCVQPIFISSQVPIQQLQPTQHDHALLSDNLTSYFTERLSANTIDGNCKYFRLGIRQSLQSSEQIDIDTKDNKLLSYVR